MQRKSTSLVAGPVPLYFQIAQDLRDRILRGEFKSGAALPTEEQLCASYGVSRSTVRQAIADLHAQHLISRRRGLGTFVKDPQESHQRLTPVGSIHEALNYVKGTRYEVLRREEIEAPADVRELLGLPAGERVTHVESLGVLDGEPIVHLLLYFPLAIGRRLEARDFSSRGPLVPALEGKLGQRARRAQQLVEAEIASATTSKLLGLRTKTAILKITRVFFLGSGAPMQALIARHHPERFKLHIELQERAA
jgi:GntR family transcriptional regulator